VCRVDISPVGRCRGSAHREKFFAKFLTIWVPTQLHVSVSPNFEGAHSLPCYGRLAAAFSESRGWVLQEADGTGPLALGEGPDLSLLLMSYRRGSRARVLSHPSPIGPACRERAVSGERYAANRSELGGSSRYFVFGGKRKAADRLEWRGPQCNHAEARIVYPTSQLPLANDMAGVGR